MIDDDGDISFDVRADVIDSLHEIFAQKRLEKLRRGSFCMEGDRLVIYTVLERSPKKFLFSGPELPDLIQSFVGDIETSCWATTKAEREVKQHRRLAYIAKK